MKLLYFNLGKMVRKFFYKAGDTEFEFYINRTQDPDSRMAGKAEIVWKGRDDMAFKQFMYELIDSYEMYTKNLGKIYDMIEADIKTV